MPPNIPPRQAIHDSFPGVLVEVLGRFSLAATSVDGAETVRNGPLIVRYGVQYLGKPHLCIVPDLVVLDYGDGLSSEEAWKFIFKNSNLYPRADVFGYRQDGVDDMVVIKQLDVMAPLRVLVYDNASATEPLAVAEALIGPAPENIPARLLENITQFGSIQEWQQTDREFNS